VINLLDFNFLDRLSDFHNSFHLREDFQKDYILTDALEMHFIEMPKFRILNEKDLKRNLLHRWLVSVDKTSPEKLIREVTKMDTAIAMTGDKMEAIRRDPELWYSYYQHERSVREYESGILQAERSGKQEGIRDVARWLKSQNMPFDQISEGTGLSPDEIAKL
jgi:predicted transposase/invertase (TIGR01784 family)